MVLRVNGKTVRVSPARSIGKGGEADVYDLGGGRALKVFKDGTHPDYAGRPYEQQAARDRITEHQIKLPAFPLSLPSRVVAPDDLATGPDGRIIGYAMRLLRGVDPLLRYADRAFRRGRFADPTVVTIFRDLHRTMEHTHRAGVVIGDFNDLNVLVAGADAHLIDADSFQFDRFPCRVFTARFVDPLLCDPAAVPLILNRPHREDSDWYAFTVMLMQCLLFVGPYGGIYHPKASAQRITHDARPLRRVTVFHPEVRYPKPAVPYAVLPDDLLHHFHLVFEKDHRGPFPLRLLETLRWTRCATCGTEHARMLCPTCAPTAPAAVKETLTIRGTVTATTIFRTRGLILCATLQGGTLRRLSYENGRFMREDGTVAFTGLLPSRLRVRLLGAATVAGTSSRVLTFTAERPPAPMSVDCCGTEPAFDTTDRARYWVDNGRLLRDGAWGSEHIGDVLAGQTRFWVSPRFGFGLYRAGELSVAFVFNAAGGPLNDSVSLPPLRGELLDADCAFTEHRCWFMTATQEGGRTIHQCVVIRADGSLEAAARAEEHDGSWLGTLRGKCAAGDFLLAATDDGIVRVEPNGGRLVKTRDFPDTEPFVDAGCRLLAGNEGLYVVDQSEIRLLTVR